MPDPTQNPTDPQPDFAPTASTPDQAAEQDATVNPTPDTAPDEQPGASSTTPGSTQQNMGDGAGIRGDYGDASQTNGLEGGPTGYDPDTPDRPMTDTELTGS